MRRALWTLTAAAAGTTSGAAETFCSDLFPGPPTFDFTSKLSKLSDRAHLFSKPVFYAVDDGLQMSVDNLLKNHGQIEVDVRTNADTSAARYGFNMPHAYALPLVDALANVSAAPKGKNRPLIFTWGRPGLVQELLSKLTIEDDSKLRLDALREHTMLRHVISIGTDEHGLSMHHHDESWLLMITGQKRWLLMDVNDPVVEEKWQALMRAQPDKAHTHAWAWDPNGPLRRKSMWNPGIATECVQRAGEIMFLPQQWWHSTWNEGITIGIGGQMHSPGLHRAAGADDVEAAKLLCMPYGNACHKSPLNVKNDLGRTPMHSAAAAGSTQMLRWMRSQGFDDYMTMDKAGLVPLIHAANGGHVEAVAFFHNDAGIPTSWGSGARGRKSIHAAAGYGQIGVVQWLVENGVSIHELDGKGSEPIHVAVGGTHPEMVKWLLDNGAHRSSRGEADFTPLMIAQQMGNNEDVKDILQNHYPINPPTQKRQRGRKGRRSRPKREL